MTPHARLVPIGSGHAVTALHYQAEEPAVGAAIILAHGAGAGQRSAFMVSFSCAMAALGFDAVTFNFLYTEQQRRMPDRAPALEACYRAVVHETRRLVPSAWQWLFIGGKSMGGRMATQIAAADPELPVAGLVLLGYPLHPPGRPEKRRDSHLAAIRRPMLVVQGSRDTFGTPEELRPAFGAISPLSAVHVVEGGDHSFKVSRAGAPRQAEIDSDVRRTAAEWMRDVMRSGGATLPPRV